MTTTQTWTCEWCGTAHHDPDSYTACTKMHKPPYIDMEPEELRAEIKRLAVERDALQYELDRLKRVMHWVELPSEEAKTVEPINWTPSPRKIQFGEGMVIADIALGVDHTATIFCEEEVKDLAAALFIRPAPPSEERATMISKLNAQECCQAHGGVGANPGRCEDCPRTIADMLAADADSIDRLMQWQTFSLNEIAALEQKLAADARPKLNLDRAPEQKVAVPQCLIWSETAGGAWESGPYLVSERVDDRGWNCTALFGSGLVTLAMSVTKEQAMDIAEKHAAAPNQMEVPQGWKLVPIEPTQAMCQAGQDTARQWPKFPLRIVPIFNAMLAAAPQPPQDGRL